MKFLQNVPYSNVVESQRFLASQLKHDQVQEPEKLIFHCYWFGVLDWKHLTSIASCLVAHKKPAVKSVWVWLDVQFTDNQKNHDFLAALQQQHPELTIKYYNGEKLSEGTPLEKATNGFLHSTEHLALRADCARYLILYFFGGVYFDLDFIFLRSLLPLCHLEFVYEWSSTKTGNNALMRLKLHSKTGMEILIAVKRLGSRMTNARDVFQSRAFPELFCLPCPWFDPLWQIEDGNEKVEVIHEAMSLRSFDDFFTKKISPKQKMSSFFPLLFGYHWHNRWTKKANQRSWLKQMYRELINDK